MKTEKKTKPTVKHPLFKISQNGESHWLWIIARNAGEALEKAQRSWKNKKRDESPKSISITRDGTVDYIPALKRPHWES
jgi:hypothetical protein